MARVAALNGDFENAKAFKIEAAKAASEVADTEDRQITEGDLNSAPWFGV